MWIYGIILLVAFTSQSICGPVTISSCPELCECNNITSLHCHSEQFFDTLTFAQTNRIRFLDLSGLNLIQLHLKITYFENLKSINLAKNQISNVSLLSYLPNLANVNLNGNKITMITANQLPINLERIDLSRNYLRHIPDVLLTLKKLVLVKLHDNPIECNCDNINKYKRLIQGSKPITCFTPDEFRGRLITEITCVNDKAIYEHMQGDEAVEGSGNEDEYDVSTSDPISESFRKTDASKLIDEDLILSSYNQQNDTESDEFSGDGTIFTTTEEPEDYDDENKDDDIIDSTLGPLFEPFDETDNRTKGCTLTTCDPLSLNDLLNDTDSLPSLQFVDGVKIMFEDLTGKEIAPSTESTTDDILIVTTTEVIEQMVKAVKIPNDLAIVRTNKDDKLTEEIKEEPQKSTINSTLIIVLGLLIVMICLIIYSVLRKRRNAHHKRKPDKSTEMKPMTLNGTTIEKTPIVSKQNGNATNEKSEMKDDMEHIPYADQTDDDDVILRSAEEGDHLLTPEAHRVTIQVKELNKPKTPLLVNRQLTDGGSFVTIPNDDQNGDV